MDKSNLILNGTGCSLIHSLEHIKLQNMERQDYYSVEDKKNHGESFLKTREIPSPYDAIVRGEDKSFWEIEVMSFKVTWSTAFKKSSTGFLSRGKTYFSYWQYSLSSIQQMQATIAIFYTETTATLLCFLCTKIKSNMVSIHIQFQLCTLTSINILF